MILALCGLANNPSRQDSAFSSFAASPPHFLTFHNPPFPIRQPPHFTIVPLCWKSLDLGPKKWKFPYTKNSRETDESSSSLDCWREPLLSLLSLSCCCTVSTNIYTATLIEVYNAPSGSPVGSSTFPLTTLLSNTFRRPPISCQRPQRPRPPQPLPSLSPQPRSWKIYPQTSPHAIKSDA